MTDITKGNTFADMTAKAAAQKQPKLKHTAPQAEIKMVSTRKTTNQSSQKVLLKAKYKRG